MYQPKEIFKSILHKLAHLTGNNYEEVETWWENDKLMVGFRCSGCGKLSGVHESETEK